MKVTVRSTNLTGVHTAFSCESVAEALNTANILANPLGFALGHNKEIGTSRWKYTNEDPTIIVSNNEIIFDFKCERIMGEGLVGVKPKIVRP